MNKSTAVNASTCQPDREEPSLAGFLLAHSGFRADFGKLATVLAGPPRDAGHAALIEDQVAFLLGYLHHHHHDEDIWLWPTLRDRAPASIPLLDALEEQHQDIEPDVTIAGDPSRPRGDRAKAFQRLHEAINRHLDDEERTAIPLVRAHVTAAEWAAQAKAIIDSYDRKRVPTLFAWSCADGDPAMVRTAINEFPFPVRFLFRRVWWPAYRRRHLALYGIELRRHATG